MRVQAANVILGIAGAGILTALGYLWLEQQELGKRQDALEQAGAIQLARIEECRALADEIISRNAALQFTASEQARQLFEQRGCNETRQADAQGS